jgi:hypothetical protein
MLSSVLRSPRAIQVNIEILRACVRMRSQLGMPQRGCFSFLTLPASSSRSTLRSVVSRS